MTYSIVARDPQTGFFGIAVASRFFAVGGIVPHIRPSTGAIATQAFVNPLYGIEGLKRLDAGRAPAEVAAEILAMDGGRNQRQFHLIDTLGRNFAHTGVECIDWAGHLLAENVSVAGNVLSGPQVVAVTLKTF